MQEQGQGRQGCLDADISGQGVVQRQIIPRPKKIRKIFRLHMEFSTKIEEVKCFELI